MKLKATYAFLRLGCLPTGLVILWMGWALPSDWGKFLSVLVGMLATSLGAFVIQNVYFSRNRTHTAPPLPLETWPLTHDRLHNSNVDLIWFHDAFYLVHAASPFHFGNKHSILLVKRSSDGRNWEQVVMLEGGAEDLRDPKLAVIGGRLFLYVFLNRGTLPLPYTTRVTWTEDGEHWSELAPVGHEGWLFWRPKTCDGQTWCVPAYWHQFHHNVLFTTSDGLHFEQLATISTGRFINEPEIEFLPDGCLLATGRADYRKKSFQQLIGIPQTSTVLSTAPPPYTIWQETAESQLTRLDGPVMFRHHGRVYAVGRAHLSSGTIFSRRGSCLAKKRTAIYEARPEGLTHLLDLPSCGDTSYAGVVIKDGYVHIVYYTNNPQKDYFWLFGMMEPSEIRIAKIALNDLERLAQKETSRALAH